MKTLLTFAGKSVDCDVGIGVLVMSLDGKCLASNEDFKRDLLTDSSQTEEFLKWAEKEISHLVSSGDLEYKTTWMAGGNRFIVKFSLCGTNFVVTIYPFQFAHEDSRKIIDAMGRFYRTVMTAVSEEEMFQGVCDTFVEVGNFVLCWIGMVDKESLEVIPIASRGFEHGYLNSLTISVKDNEWGRGPTGTSIRERRPVVALDILNDPHFLPWRKDAIKRGYSSSLSVPIILEDDVIGSINLYSRHKDTFSPDIISLVESVAEYVGHAITLIRNRNELISKEKRFEEVLNSSPIGIVVIQGSEMVYVNPHLVSIFGYGDESELIGQKIDILQPEELREKLRSMGRKRESGMYAPPRYEAVGLKRNGERFPIRVHASRMLFQGTPSTLAFIEDLSELKSYETQLKDAELKVYQAHKMEALGQLAGGISHDFNNILTSISGAAELLQMELEDNPSLISLVDQILASCKYGSSLSSQLLTFARKTTVDLKPVNVSNVIEQLTEIMRRTVDKRITIIEEIELQPAMVLGNEDRLFNALLNLCLNARDAILDKGEITVAVARKDQHRISHVLITVSDTGVGIPPSIQEKIFEPFFSTKGLGKGTGLGLSTVHGVVQEHGGKIWFETSPEGGTTFFIMLPELKEPVKINNNKETDISPTGQRLSLLLIDDDMNVLNIIKRFLEVSGHTCEGYASGKEALEHLRENSEKYDCIVLDINMPEINGWDVLAELESIKCDVKVILATGNLVVDGDKYDLYKDNIIGILKKPFSRKELQEMLVPLLNGG